MPTQFLSPKSDLVFKLIFGTPGNIDILADFLHSVLDIPREEFDHLELKDPALKPDIPGGKEVTLDIHAVLARGIIINVEMQKYPHPYMWERIQLYLDILFIGQIRRGEGYHVLKKVVGIVITDYILVRGNTQYHNREQQLSPGFGRIGADLKETHILELPKLPGEPDGSELWKWMKFINGLEEEDFTMIAQMGMKFKKAVEILREISEDDETRAVNEAREKARRDEAARLYGAREEGIAEGLNWGRIEGLGKGKEDGIAEGKAEVAVNLYGIGMPLDLITNVTGLSAETILGLVGQ